MNKEQYRVHKEVRDFFEQRGIECSLRGNPDDPTIILNKGLILGAKLDFAGATYILKGLTFRGPGNAEIERIPLRTSFPTSTLIELIREADNKLGWRLKMEGTDLFVQSWQVDYAKTSKFARRHRRYPLFSKFDPMILPEKEAFKLASMIYDYDVVPSQYDGGSLYFDYDQHVPTTC